MGSRLKFVFAVSLLLHLLGQADCSAIQSGKQCLEPNNLVSHASFAFNDYYKKHEATPEACNFEGTGVQVNKDPNKSITLCII
ncbi:hypothetical protein V6N11_030041 [Hibiscus sabdariffa]|uniref:X8 domain-containing protein n=1 Tax=Hibiscus sabdariffa TaxID=183260 RepID=A0ABR2PJU0_9ROSI